MDSLEKLKISKNVTTIDEYAFYGCKNLKTIYAFEPDKRNFKKLSLWAEGERFPVTPLNLAAWSHKETLFFDGGGSRNSNLIKSDSLEVGEAAKIVEVNANSLDNILAGERVDYIKFDVEGAEREALEGSDKIISKDMPTLLVSLYHRSRDVFELVNTVKEKYPEYKLYLRRLRCLPAWEIDLIAINNS